MSKRTSSENKTTVSEKDVRPSLHLKLIRHAESNNNTVYRNARYIYRGGTPDFDEAGWWKYVDTHRHHDPGLSSDGQIQAQHLATYLGPHIQTQASQPLHVITSPMRRTLETIKPTIEYLVKETQENSTPPHAVKVTVQ
jgi:broad specificity phosphatase PhoE